MSTEAPRWPGRRAGSVATVDEAGAVGEEAEEQRSDDAADEVDAHYVERVIEPELELQVDRECTDDTSDDAEHDCPALESANHTPG